MIDSDLDDFEIKTTRADDVVDEVPLSRHPN